MVLLVIIIFTILYLVRLPALLQPGYRRDLIVFTVLMALDLGLGILMAAGVKLPFLATEITKFFKAYILR